MDGSLVSALGLDPEVWLFLSLLGCVTLFFKFSRFWSVRNLDLLLLFVLVPGMMLIVGSRARPPVGGLYLAVRGIGAWLVRCMLDLGLTRRPLLEPNLNASGLLCLSVGLLGLLLAETVSLPVHGRGRAQPGGAPRREDRPPAAPGEGGEKAAEMKQAIEPWLPNLAQKEASSR